MEQYLPPDTDEIVSGGASGIDRCAAECARRNGWKLTEFRPDYSRYGRGAPLIRSRQIVEYADTVIAFWDGQSPGTRYTVGYCRKIGRSIRVQIQMNGSWNGSSVNVQLLGHIGMYVTGSDPEISTYTLPDGSAASLSASETVSGAWSVYSFYLRDGAIYSLRMHGDSKKELLRTTKEILDTLK